MRSERVAVTHTLQTLALLSTQLTASREAWERTDASPERDDLLAHLRELEAAFALVVDHVERFKHALPPLPPDIL